MPHDQHEHGQDCGCGHEHDADKAAAFAEFERKLAEQGLSMETFSELPQHEQIKLLNKYLTADLPAREIGPGDWREAINAMLEIEPAEQMDDLFTLEDSDWTVIEIPATVTGKKGDSFHSEMALPNVHGKEHGVETESATMGVQLIRSVPGAPKAFLINFYQTWAKYAHVFCAIELERIEAEGGDDDAEEQYKFVKGVFHPGFVGLIDEEELEFLGFVESFAADAGAKGDGGDMLPGKWIARRNDSRLYMPGAPAADGRATLVDCEDKTVYAADYLTTKVPEAV